MFNVSTLAIFLGRAKLENSWQWDSLYASASYFLVRRVDPSAAFVYLSRTIKQAHNSDCQTESFMMVLVSGEWELISCLFNQLSTETWLPVSMSNLVWIHSILGELLPFYWFQNGGRRHLPFLHYVYFGTKSDCWAPLSTFTVLRWRLRVVTWWKFYNGRFSSKIFVRSPVFAPNFHFGGIF